MESAFHFRLKFASFCELCNNTIHRASFLAVIYYLSCVKLIFSFWNKVVHFLRNSMKTIMEFVAAFASNCELFLPENFCQWRVFFSFYQFSSFHIGLMLFLGVPCSLITACWGTLGLQMMGARRLLYR